MAPSSTDADAQLPPSHYFVTVARGCSMRTYPVRTEVMRLGLCLLPLLAVWLAGSTLYLAFHDDLVASVMAREARMQYAYEDRIAALRGQVEHESSRQLVSQNTVEGKLRELSLKASALEMRASLFAQLAERGGLHPSDYGVHLPKTVNAASGPGALDGPAPADVTGAIPSRPDGGLPGKSFALPLPEDKPHPEAELGGEFGPPASGPVAGAASVRARLAGLAESLEQTDGAQYEAVAEIDAALRKKAEGLRSIIASVGLSPERFKPAAIPAATGGPFVPLESGLSTSPFGQALASLQTDVMAAERLRSILPYVPLASPLQGEAEVTSPFGARLDPFLGRPAMHTGVDLREGYGTDVRAPAPGRVVHAGPAGGYGNMVEIDHGNGLSTRYGHLSTILVTEGQKIDKGIVIGLVGATGRATGPHLHYETRIDGEPVDPMRFLAAGQHLARLDAAL